MKNKMTAGEAAEILNRLANNDYVDYDNALGAMRYAASVLRRVASGELAEVPAGWPVTIGQKVGRWKIVGANYQERTITLMDGKDDSHEAD